jgi:hypothetical protein
MVKIFAVIFLISTAAEAGEKAAYPMNTIGPPTYRFTPERGDPSSVKIRVQKVRKAIIDPVRRKP